MTPASTFFHCFWLEHTMTHHGRLLILAVLCIHQPLARGDSKGTKEPLGRTKLFQPTDTTDLSQIRTLSSADSSLWYQDQLQQNKYYYQHQAPFKRRKSKKKVKGNFSLDFQGHEVSTALGRSLNDTIFAQDPSVTLTLDPSSLVRSVVAGFHFTTSLSSAFMGTLRLLAPL